MAELPGWDRDRLAGASTRDVAAARWVVFARVLEPLITEDFESERERLEVDAMTGARQKSAVDRMRRRAIGEIAKALRRQREARKTLLLDGPDEPDDDLEEVG